MRPLPTLCFLLASSLSLVAQGPLTPPGPPAPTMKSLDQVEARIPINGTTTPGDDNYHFVISQPGSYYLTGNLNVTRPNGIDVRAAGVTLDLNGFRIVRTAGSGGNGVDVQDAADRCKVRNGTLAGFTIGLNGRSGAEGGAATGDGWEVTSCRAHANGGAGILAGFGCTVSRCTAYDNGGVGIFARRGQISHCTAAENGGDGIQTGVATSVIANTATANAGNGIHVNSNCLVQGNTCDLNGEGGDGAGIYMSAGGNRIEGNNVTFNDRGIHAFGGGNLIIKNSARGNTIEYKMADNNRYGQIVDTRPVAAPAFEGPEAGSTINTFDPWANFTY